jgi:hypothetical protein
MTGALTRTVVRVPATGVIAAIESSWSKGHASLADEVEIDLQDCRYIDVPALVYLVSRLVQRQQCERRTTLRLPSERKVRDFLRDWEFPTAVSDALGVSFKALVVEDQHHYFGERSTAGKKDRNYWSSEPTLPPHAFPIRTFFAASREFGQRLATRQTADWQQRYVLAVLNHHLRGRGRRISTHIVHEAIMNAVRHPDARLVQTASHFSQPGGKGDGHLTITVWDDGSSIYETLSQALERGVQFARTSAPSLERTFDVIVERPGSLPTPPVELKSSTVPTRETAPELILLSSVFPGVTSAPGRVINDAHRDVVSDDESFGLPGMGLFVLMNTVIDVFGGELAIRSGRFFMNLKGGERVGAHHLPSIRCKIAVHDEADQLLGNMITVRIPVQRAAADDG